MLYGHFYGAGIKDQKTKESWVPGREMDFSGPAIFF